MLVSSTCKSRLHVGEGRDPLQGFLVIGNGLHLFAVDPVDGYFLIDNPLLDLFDHFCSLADLLVGQVALMGLRQFRPFHLGV